MELIVVVGIVLVLVALLFPVLSRAKVAALESQEASQLKQLSVAHGVYVADYDDAEPGSSVPLVTGGYAPRELVSLALDQFPDGWANFGRVGDFERPVPWKDSFVTLRMSAGEMFFQRFRESENGGWLISAGWSRRDPKGRAEDILFTNAPYRRLTFGGSVIRRIFSVYRRPDGEVGIFMDRCFSDEEVIPDNP